MPGPPELPGSTAPRIAVTCRVIGPRPYASRLRTSRGAAEACGRAGERPVPRVADERNRRRPAPAAATGSGRAPSPATRRTARSFVTSNATTVDGERPPARRVDARPRGCPRRRARSSRRAPASRPSRSPRRPGRTRSRSRGRRSSTRGRRPESRATPLLRRRDDRRRAEEHADRIDPLELLEQPLGREHLVDLREDRRALHGPPQLGLARDVQQHGADRPAEEDTGDEARARAPRSGRAAASPE